jgi:large subunit ribosomal protein L13
LEKYKLKKHTYSAKSVDNKQEWFVINAEGQILGRLATTIAARLRGKHTPLFTPHSDTGDNLIIINADKVVLTGNKLEQKLYYRYSGYMGGLKSISARKLMEKRPEDLIKLAVKGMLPKNKLGRKLNKKLRVYAGDSHPHTAQQPKILAV